MRRPLLRPAGRILIALAGIGVGTALALAIGEDIGSAWRGGRVTQSAAPVPYAEAPSAAQRDEQADAYGFAMAQQVNARRDADCARLQEQFRRGCRSYLRFLEDRRRAAADGDPVATAFSAPPGR